MREPSNRGQLPCIRPASLALSMQGLAPVCLPCAARHSRAPMHKQTAPAPRTHPVSHTRPVTIWLRRLLEPLAPGDGLWLPCIEDSNLHLSPSARASSSSGLPSSPAWPLSSRQTNGQPDYILSPSQIRHTYCYCIKLSLFFWMKSFPRAQQWLLHHIPSLPISACHRPLQTTHQPHLLSWPPSIVCSGTQASKRPKAAVPNDCAKNLHTIVSRAL